MIAIPSTGLPSECIGKRSTSSCCRGSESCKNSFTCASGLSQLCAPYATCVPDPSGGGCKCICQSGYVGNGYRCAEGEQPQPSPVVDKDGKLQGHLPASVSSYGFVSAIVNGTSLSIRVVNHFSFSSSGLLRMSCPASGLVYWCCAERASSVRKYFKWLPSPVRDRLCGGKSDPTEQVNNLLVEKRCRSHRCI